MVDKSLQELKDEAVSLGLDPKGLKSKADVAKLIEDSKESQTADDSVDEVQEVIETPVEVKKEVKPSNKPRSMAEVARDLKTAAMKTKVVTITSNDKRDNHLTSTCFLSSENQYFGISKIVPLDVPVELEQCLIDTAKAVEVVLHQDEIIDGKRTGNKRPKLVKKYVVSYEQV